MSARSPWQFGLPLLLLSVLICLAVGEAASRALQLSSTWTSYIAGRNMNLAETLTKQSVGFTRIPGMTFPMPFNQTFSINRAGFRDRDFATAKRAGTARVAFLGDSVMEGYAVDAEARMPNIARKLLFAEKRSQYEMLNFGVAGHSTADEYVVLRDIALAYHPDIVVVQMGWNDFNDNLRKLPVIEHTAREVDVPAILPAAAPAGGLKGFLQAHSAFYLTIAERYSLLRLRHGGSNDLLDRVIATTAEESAATDRLVAMIAAAAGPGIPVYVIYVPLDVEVQTAREQDARVLSDRVQAMCRAHRVSCIDALTPLRAHRGEALYVDDAHLTSAGHRLVGAAIAAALSGAAR